MWALDGARALVATTDFLTPVVDEPRTWGRIAAQNAVSDIYAMGGRPLFALNLVAWPSELPMSMLAEVLAGGAEIGAESGFVVVGGHTVEDPEPKYGLAVVGEVDPGSILRNSGLRDGEVLVLTKALGIGTVTTAIKADAAPSAVRQAAVASMTASNAAAAAVAVAAGATGATDVTGFGLLGHLMKMAAASGMDAVIDVDAVPVLAGARDLAAAGFVPGGSRRNLAWVTPALDVNGRSELDVLMLADAQTSGGLLFGVVPARVDDVLAQLDPPAAVIGTVRAGTGRIVLR